MGNNPITFNNHMWYVVSLLPLSLLSLRHGNVPFAHMSSAARGVTPAMFTSKLAKFFNLISYSYVIPPAIILLSFRD